MQGITNERLRLRSRATVFAFSCTGESRSSTRVCKRVYVITELGAGNCYYVKCYCTHARAPLIDGLGRAGHA